MKTLSRWIAVTVAIGLLTTTALAGDCCKKTAKDTRAGKTCDKCVTEQCCKDTAKRISEKGKAKSCEKCAAKKEGEKSKKKS